MTQKEHAALASVSVPTMIAFDRGEHSLSLGKALDILRVVGLVQETPSAANTQEAFVQSAFTRWRELTKELPKTSPGRFPNGWYRIDYALDGNLKEIDLSTLRSALAEAVVPHTGWPLFWVPKRPEIAPYEKDGEIECWMPPGDINTGRGFSDAAHCDFWRASSPGRMMVMRGYQEDSQETFPPGTIFDTTLPIWRLGEAFLHAANLALELGYAPGDTKVRLRALYTGLTGRDLRSWANPMSGDFVDGGRSRTDEAMLEGTASVAEIGSNLGAQVYPLVASLYERFGVTGLSPEFVEGELKRMRKNRLGR